MKKIVGILLGALLLTGCTSSSTSVEKKTTKSTESLNITSTELANPWETCETMKEIKKIAGFSLKCPNTLLEGKSVKFQAMKDEMVQVIYYDQGGNELFTIRKAPRTDDESISGDYNEYVEELDTDTEGVEFHLQSNDEGYTVIEWSKDGYQYCVLAEDNPLSTEEFQTISSKIK